MSRSSHAVPVAGSPWSLILAAVLSLAAAVLITLPSAAHPVGGLPEAGDATRQAGASPLPMLVAIRAAHQPGFDRLVFQFDSATVPTATVRRVTHVVHDGSGLPVPIPGRSLLQVTFAGAQAHTSTGAPSVSLSRAYALPNVLALRGAGDFEGVVTLGVGLARKQPYKVTGLGHPGRLVIDVSTKFARTWRRVTLVDISAPHSPAMPGLVAVRRPVPNATPVTGILDRILAGPTASERARGVRLVASGATGFTHVSVDRRIARVRLAGRCVATLDVTIADEVMASLRRLGAVRWVKISDPDGRTRYPTGNRDSIPNCLA